MFRALIMPIVRRSDYTEKLPAADACNNFIILCYIGRKYICICFCGGQQFQDLNAQKVRAQETTGFLKVIILKARAVEP
jgi:hypothetical protein